MPNYDFRTDLPIAEKTEHEIANLLREHYNAVILSYCHNNKYDILAKINGKNFTFEVKEDFTCERTGNVGVEYSSWGRMSGIATSKADFYIYKIHTHAGVRVFIFKTKTIKDMIERKEYSRVVNGGDKGSNSMNFLFAYDVFTSHGKRIA
jgi:hypothetical protein